VQSLQAAQQCAVDLLEIWSPWIGAATPRIDPLARGGMPKNSSKPLFCGWL
jgi:hypothetical protein